MKVFLSYSAADKDLATDLISRLRAEGFEVGQDEEVGPGDNWALAIGKALEESDAMIVLLSPDAAKSEWVEREIEYALTSPRYKNRLLPVLVKPTRRIPWILRKLPLIRLYENPVDGTDRVVDEVRQLAKATG
ncbi:MAG: toll/interleukin-1 receptor domain-containing protein [Planctomycetota bacterium]